MLQLTLTENQRTELFESKKEDLHPIVRKKIEVILLKDEKISQNSICRIMGLSKNTVRKYIREYIKGGLGKLMKLNYSPQKSELEAYSEMLKEYFEKNPPRSIQQAIDAIFSLTGILRKPTQVRAFLKKLGFKCQKVGMIPKKVDVEEQEKFKEEKLEPRIQEAKDGKRTLFFVDAAHFVFAPFLGYLWSLTRLYVEAPAGRNRFSVLAAVDAITLEIVKVATDGSVNADSLKQLLDLIYKLNLKTPITLVLDNARYQHCNAVKYYAAALNIELLFLPTYSPNLNLIERLWKFVKKQCLYCRTYNTFSDFCFAITNTIDKTSTAHRESFKSLMTLNFQSFKEIKESGRIIRL